MPKLAEFYPSKASGSNDHLTEDGEEVMQFWVDNQSYNLYNLTKTERKGNHNFRHFRSFLILAHLGMKGYTGRGAPQGALRTKGRY